MSCMVKYVYATGCIVEAGDVSELPAPGLWIVREWCHGSVSGRYAIDHIALCRWGDGSRMDAGVDAPQLARGQAQLGWDQLPSWPAFTGERETDPPARLLIIGQATHYSLAA